MTYRLTARATPDGTVIFFETKIREEYDTQKAGRITKIAK